MDEPPLMFTALPLCSCVSHEVVHSLPFRLKPVSHGAAELFRHHHGGDVSDLVSGSRAGFGSGIQVACSWGIQSYLLYCEQGDTVMEPRPWGSSRTEPEEKVVGPIHPDPVASSCEPPWGLVPTPHSADWHGSPPSPDTPWYDRYMYTLGVKDYKKNGL